MDIKQRIRSDFEFCEEDTAEFVSVNGGYRAPLLRTVAALNTDATRAQFVEVAVERGYNKSTAQTQFYQSRKITQSMDGGLLLPDGRLEF